jgi:23S rRNA (uracil1939-C5)-methyltransferase
VLKNHRVDAPELVLEPTAMVAGGAPLARHPDGRVVFVDGALPGEEVRVVITRERRDVVHGVTAAVLRASPDRLEPPCPHVAEGCGGCSWQHIEPAAQRAYKETIVRDALRRIARLPDAAVAAGDALPATGFRTTVRAAVDGDGRPGLRRRSSHDLVGVDGCLVAHPLVEEMLRTSRFPGAEEVVLRCSVATGERVAAPRPASRTQNVVVPDGVTVASKDSPGFVHEEVAGRRWRVGAASFFQSRPDGATVLCELVAAAIPEDARTAADLYAGVGVFAGVLAARGLDVVAVERHGAAVADARHNLADLPVRIERSDVSRWKPRPVDLVVADPSREGLGSSGVAVLAGTGAARVVLVSCDAAAMARDTALLRQRGYDLTAVTLVDLFPHTAHVEVVSQFDRVRATVSR